jgi:hypothetical protein
MGLFVMFAIPVLAFALVATFRLAPKPVGWGDTVQGQVVVAADAGLQPLQEIRGSDLTTADTRTVSGAILTPTTVVGRYAARRLPAGAVVRESDLIPAGSPVPQTLVLVLPAGTVGAKGAPNTPVTLMFAPRERGEKAPQPVFARDVQIISVDRVPANGTSDGQPTETVVVKLQPSDLAKVVPLLGISDVFVLT